MIESGVYRPEFTEWLELTELVRMVLMRDAPVDSAARYWQDYHYGHVIDQASFPLLVSRYASFFPTPSRVAVLLPTDGGLAAAGRAIRDGIISAYMEQPGDATLRFYSSGDTDESVLAAYYRALEEGATQIIGPLRMESTQVLASLDHHATPILLLNDPAINLEPDPGQVFKVSSLSLSQTEEAAAIAVQALDRGMSRAIVIVPEDAWGQRIETAFSSEFVQRGGQIPAGVRFNPATSDHSAVLTRMLRIDESRQRKQDLQSRLGIPLQFEPIRRDDFDCIFLAASPAQGRELKPLFKFHDAGDVPVLAMGRVYSGRTGEDSDLDLDDVIFPVTPWQLKVSGKPLPALESLRQGSYGNLFALGRDAWQLLPWLPLLRKDPDLEFHGNTGSLSLKANGQLSREPAWARFSKGLPVAYKWPDQH
jgi:outer membrane PBP1 activator LpoA protein